MKFKENSSMLLGNFDKMKKLIFNADVSELENIFNELNKLLEDYDTDEIAVMKLKLVLEEIFTNISNYAYNDKGIVEFLVDIISNHQLEIIIKLIDEGEYFNPLEQATPDTTLSSDEREIGGLGILLIKKNVDVIEYERVDNKNILTIHKILN